MARKTYGKLGNKIGNLISDFAISVLKAEKAVSKLSVKKGVYHDPVYIDKYNKAHAKCVWGIIEAVFEALS